MATDEINGRILEREPLGSQQVRLYMTDEHWCASARPAIKTSLCREADSVPVTEVTPIQTCACFIIAECQGCFAQLISWHALCRAGFVMPSGATETQENTMEKVVE